MPTVGRRELWNSMATTHDTIRRRVGGSVGTPTSIAPVAAFAVDPSVTVNALDAGVPLRDTQILARPADPRITEHYDRARGNLDPHGVHFLTAYVTGVEDPYRNFVRAVELTF